ncbi:hypothetical protein GCM10017044_10610 [Kordiimonas sediminis]|uniref:PAS domain-containing protein n=1 Tax=Kordiimonas sediminis TaxID=1735581 RepID=A0A919E6U2_9PROT|nr:hypothetical protein [Kordiimonas sediminis]GHF17987.1 hypothetical protein GCM10017044_10610 [Kordiimonas sediminis]
MSSYYSKMNQVIEGPAFKNGVCKEDRWGAFVSELPSPQSRQVANLWKKLCAETRSMPKRHALTLRNLCGNALRVMVIDNPMDRNECVIKLYGSELSGKVGANLTNWRLEDTALDDVQADFWFKNFEMFQEPRPYISIYQQRGFGVADKLSYTLNLPVQIEEGHVAGFLYQSLYRLTDYYTVKDGSASDRHSGGSKGGGNDDPSISSFRGDGAVVNLRTFGSLRTFH